MAGSVAERVRASMGRRREASTISSYASFANRFAKFAHKQEGFTEDDALRYIDFLIDEGYSDSSIKWTYHALKRTYRAVGSPFTVTLEDLPLGLHGPQHRPVLSKDEVGGLIAFTKACGSKAVRLYLAMSTVYGLRRIELSRLRPESFSDGKVMIATAKHGDERLHLVPEEIQPIVREALQAEALGYSTSGLTVMFRELCRSAGLVKNGSLGWHSIRRSLDTCLIDANLPYYTIKSFLRWKASPTDMAGHYYRPDPAAVDREVFAVHPFVPEWDRKR